MGGFFHFRVAVNLLAAWSEVLLANCGFGHLPSHGSEITYTGDRFFFPKGAGGDAPAFLISKP
jgi:hypothetical protein